MFPTCAFEKKPWLYRSLDWQDIRSCSPFFSVKKPCKETLRTYLSIAHRSGFVFVWSMDLLCPSKPKRLLTEARYYLIANIPAVAGRIPQSKRGKKKNSLPLLYLHTLISSICNLYNRRSRASDWHMWAKNRSLAGTSFSRSRRVPSTLRLSKKVFLHNFFQLASFNWHLTRYSGEVLM